jgi:heparin binding hemagglutinin HbhA
MSTVTDFRKSVTEATPVLAVVGAADLAVERVRSLAAQVEQAAADLDTKALQSQVANVPTLAVNRALVVANEVAVQVETQYESLAARGKKLVDRVQSQKATKDLVTKGKATLSRTQAAVTTARKNVATVVEETAGEAEQVVELATAQARSAVSRVAAVGRSVKAGDVPARRTPVKRATRKVGTAKPAPVKSAPVKSASAKVEAVEKA